MMRTGDELRVSGAVKRASFEAKPGSILSIFGSASSIVSVTLAGSSERRFVSLTPVGHVGFTLPSEEDARLFIKSPTFCAGAV